MSSPYEVRQLLTMMNREEIQRRIQALEAEKKKLNAELTSTKVVYPVKGTRTANEEKQYHTTTPSQPRLKRKLVHTDYVHSTKIHLSTNRNADQRYISNGNNDEIVPRNERKRRADEDNNHPTKRICVSPNNSARQKSPASSKRRSLSRENRGKMHSPSNSPSPERKAYKTDFQTSRGRKLSRSPIKQKKRSGSKKYRSPSSSASPPRHYAGKSRGSVVQQKKQNRSPSSGHLSNNKHTRFSSLAIEQSPKIKPTDAIPQKKMKETSSPPNPAKLKSIIKPKNKGSEERRINKIQFKGKDDVDQKQPGDEPPNISNSQEGPGTLRSPTHKQSDNSARTRPYARKQDSSKPELKNNTSATIVPKNFEPQKQQLKPELKSNEFEPDTIVPKSLEPEKQQTKPETNEINNESASLPEDVEQQNKETEMAIMGIISSDSDSEQDIHFINHSLSESETLPGLNQQSSQEINDLLADLILYQESIENPSQDVTNNPTESAQNQLTVPEKLTESVSLQEEQLTAPEKFAGSVSLQEEQLTAPEEQPEFLLQFSQENLLGAIQPDPSVLAPISQLNPDLQRDVNIPQEIALPAQFTSNSLHKQEMSIKAVRDTTPVPVQFTSPSEKEPSSSSAPTSVYMKQASPKSIERKRPYRRNECTTRWTIPQFVSQEFLPFKAEFTAFKNACKSRNDRIIELINQKSENANRQFATIISEMNMLNLNR